MGSERVPLGAITQILKASIIVVKPSGYYFYEFASGSPG